MAQRTTKKKAVNSKKTPNKRNTKAMTQKAINDAIIYGAVALVVGVFLAIFIYINMDIRNVLSGGFGVMSYFLPLLICGVGVYAIKFRDIRNFWFKLAEGMGLLITVGAMASIISGVDLDFAYECGIDNMGGGVLSTAISALFISLIGTAATVVLLILLIVLFANLLTNVPI